MDKNELTEEDRKRIQSARTQGDARAHDASALVDAAYDRTTDTFRLTFRGGGEMTIPRHVIPGLEGQSSSALALVSVSPAGDALTWRELDVDVHVPGLVERAFGTRLFAAATGRRGGRQRTRAKVAAARRNGAKGGRPRKRESA